MRLPKCLWLHQPAIGAYKDRAKVALLQDVFPGSDPLAAFPINNPGEEPHMNATKITGIVLILLGLVGFFTGGFSFTKESTAAKIGPIELTVKEKESVNVPQWLSLGALALGAVLLVAGFKKS